jgi:hypothetical protein
LRSVKKPFGGEPKKTTKTPSRLAALKGFSVASGIFSFRSLALASFGSFLEERKEKSSLQKK